jgi:hypothetical protein
MGDILMLFRIAQVYADAVEPCSMSLDIVKKVLALQKTAPEDPILHEIWAGVIGRADPMQGFNHFHACAMLQTSRGQEHPARICAAKALAVAEHNRLSSSKAAEIQFLQSIVSQYY